MSTHSASAGPTRGNADRLTARCAAAMEAPIEARVPEKGSAPDCRQQVLDGHAFAIIGIDETRLDASVLPHHKRRRNRQHPGTIALIGGKILEIGHQLLHLGPD